ncbi:hypothetical protein OKW38_002223 [Paraburkholderia sp. MM5496-R1]
MRRPSIVRLDRTVARTAFSFAASSACAADPQCVRLELHRIGADDEPIRYAAAERDDSGRMVFEWDRRLFCAAPGFYKARFSVSGSTCGELVVELRDDCHVTGAENIERAADCDVFDGSPAGCGFLNCGNGARDCSPVIEIYVPPYDVPRGC